MTIYNKVIKSRNFIAEILAAIIVAEIIKAETEN